jgi:hypothetical protein
VNTTDKLAEALRLAREWFRHEEAGEGPQADDVIKAADEALAAHDAEQAQEAVPADLRSAAERTRQDLGPTGSNYPDVRVLLAFVEQALAAPTPPEPRCLITGFGSSLPRALPVCRGTGSTGGTAASRARIS